MQGISGGRPPHPIKLGILIGGAPVFYSQQAMGNGVEMEVKTTSGTQLGVTKQDVEMKYLGLKGNFGSEADDLEGKWSRNNMLVTACVD